MNKHKIEDILELYAEGYMTFTESHIMLGGSNMAERIIKQWMSGKMAFAEAISQLHELLNEKK